MSDSFKEYESFYDATVEVDYNYYRQQKADISAIKTTGDK